MFHWERYVFSCTITQQHHTETVYHVDNREELESWSERWEESYIGLYLCIRLGLQLACFMYFTAIHIGFEELLS